MPFFSARSLYLFAAAISLGLGTAQGQTLFVPNGTVSASGNGNVGIGTAFPAQKLTIQGGHGDTQFRLFSDNYQQGIDGSNTAILSLWASEPGWTWGGVGIGNNVMNSGGIVRVSNTRGGSYIRLLDNTVRLNVVDGNGYDRDGITINSAGSVGVGTTTPRQKLEVGASSNPSINIHDFGTAELTVGINESLAIAQLNTNSGGFRFVTAQDGVNFPGSGNEIVRFSASGNVGIGTTTPTHTLQIQKTSVSTPALMIGGGYYGGPRLQTYGLDADPHAWMGLGTDMGGGPYEHSIYFSDYNGMGMLTFGTYNGNTYSEKMRLTRAGNVGIGTTNPTHKLAVNGTIKAKEVIVETTGWSDYVFADDYALVPLAEVEAHIKEHKHLPGIPSATQVAEQGVSVGDMQARLLAKIEELTLHQIAQEKRALEQEKRLAAQDTRIEALETENTRLKTQLR